MTAYTKIAISLPFKAAEHVRRAVKEGRAPSASAYIARAIAERAKHDDLTSLLDEMLEETGGPMTAAEIREVDRILDSPRRIRDLRPPKRRRRKR